MLHTEHICLPRLAAKALSKLSLQMSLLMSGAAERSLLEIHELQEKQ